MLASRLIKGILLSDPRAVYMRVKKNKHMCKYFLHLGDEMTCFLDRIELGSSSLGSGRESES